MTRFSRFSFGSVVATTAVWAITALCMPADSQVKEISAKSVDSHPSATLVEADSAEPMLAARYHLRNRTNNFFKRGTKPTKSRRSFFNRRAVNVEVMPEELAARYHLRNRTNDFFKRGIV
jgi:hypothetical protein